MKTKFSEKGCTLKFSEEDFTFLLSEKEISQKINFTPNPLHLRVLLVDERFPKVNYHQEEEQEIISFLIPELMAYQLSLDKSIKEGIQIFLENGIYICLQIDVGVCH